MRTPEAMPPRYFLRCLGAPELRGPGGEPIRFRTRKHMALLAFLAVEPRQPHRRERLADLLWPDASPAEGRHSLATALSVIRGKLGPRTFESTRETVRFVAADLEVDLDRLARGDILGGDLTPPLEVGGFLDEFEVTRAPEFALWRDLRRAHWFPAIRRAFIVLMDDCRRTGDFARIEPLADRLLTLDELSEDAIRAKMEGRAFAGDRMSALRIFQQWRQKLDEELGATPSPLVEGMALRLRQRGFEPPGTAHIPTVPTDQWRDRVFVGRGPQYRVAYERWEETREGNGRHVLLLGDSGLGKTTLAERLVTAAGLEGAVSSRVQCYEVEREIPYAAIGTLVRGMLERPGANGTAPEWLAELARAVPVVAQKYPNLPPPRDIEGEAARLRLTEAVHQLATAIAEEHPLILVVDDVHLSDDASVAVLHLLMRRTQEQRVMIMLTAREPELAKSPNASRLKEVLPALALRPVELPPLTDEDMTQVLSALAAGYNRTMSPAVRRALLRASAGIPMVAELLFDDWRAHGGQCLALGIGAMTVDAQLHAGQDVFLQVVERAVSKLSDIGRAVVGLAAVLGDRLNDLGMYELVDLTLAQTLAGMSELTTMRILRDTGQCLEFRNELLRGYSYLSVPSPHRRALHGLIADRLIAAETSGETVPGLTLAWHCYRASRVEAAEQYLLRGARTALDRGATFETELALRSAMPTLQKERLGDALLLLAESLQEQGRWQESLEVLKHEGPWDEPLRIIASGFQIRARAALSEDEEELRLFVGQTVALLDAPADISLKVPVINTISVLSWRLQANDALLDRLLELFDVATQQTARASLVAAILTVAWRTRGPDALIGLRPLAAQVSDECDRAGVRNGTRFHLENARSCLEASLCSYEEALRLAHVAHDLAVHLGDDERQSVAASNIAMYLGRLGRYLEQEEWARRALATAAGVGRSWRLDRVRFQLAWALAMSGRTSRALEESLPNESNLGGAPMWMIQANGLLKADILQVCGDPNGALRVARQTLEATGLAPLSTAYAGLTARWIALSTAGSPLQAKGREILEDLLARLDTLDAFDQTEVCAAMCRFQRQQGVDFRATKEELQRKLSTLPEAAAHTLHRLGLLSDLN